MIRGVDHVACPFEWKSVARSEEHTSELQSLRHLVCRLLLEKKKKRPKRQCALSLGALQAGGGSLLRRHPGGATQFSLSRESVTGARTSGQVYVTGDHGQHIQ